MLFENLGPYKIERLIGRGGMGAVYEGTHRTTGAKHAIKTLAVALADDAAFRDRFEVEVISMQDLNHANIVRLIPQETPDGSKSFLMEQHGVLFYAMELVDGRNLHELLKERGTLPWREVVDIALQVCGALRHAHAHGAIHRDIKPANLIIDRHGNVKLTDFGIARFFDVSDLTAPGGVIGTADYMSPEQAFGQKADTMTDVYSLGAVMYALMSGRPPFVGKTSAEVLVKLKTQQPKPVCEVAPDVPRELGLIVDDLLAKDPKDRVPTLRLLEKRLKATLHGLSRGQQSTGSAEVTDGTIELGPELSSGTQPSQDEDTLIGPALDVPRGTASLDEQPTAAAGREPSLPSPEDAHGELNSPTGDDAEFSGPPSGTTPLSELGSDLEIAGEGTDGSGSLSHETPTRRRGPEQTSNSAPNAGRGEPHAPGPATVAEDGDYTLVDTRRGRSTGIRIDEEAFRHRSPLLSALSTIGLVAGLAGVIFAVWYLAQPPAADKLYAEITEVAAAGDPRKYNDVRRQMELFVEHHTSNKHHDLVAAMLSDHDGFRRWKTLRRTEGGIQALPELEKDYVEAMRPRVAKPREAIRRLQAFTRHYGESEDEQTQQLVQWARSATIVLQWLVQQSEPDETNDSK